MAYGILITKRQSQKFLGEDGVMSALFLSHTNLPTLEGYKHNSVRATYMVQQQSVFLVLPRKSLCHFPLEHAFTT